MNGDFDYPHGKEKELLERIRSGKEPLVAPAIDDIFASLGNCSRDYIVLALNHLLFEIFNALRQAMNETDGQTSADYLSLFERLRQSDTPEQIKDWLVPLILLEMRRIKDGKKAGSAALKLEIGKFIKSNYADAQLSIEKVADRFDYNPIYFGKLFKELFGQAYLDYVSGLKVDLTLRYLENRKLTVKEISGKVGFNNPSYFVTWFKKNTGVSPGDYRTRLWMNHKNAEQRVSDAPAPSVPDLPSARRSGRISDNQRP